VSGSLTIPERLRGIPEAEDPGFFEMVEYFFHKAEISLEQSRKIGFGSGTFFLGPSNLLLLHEK
jgi:hypothetical protein